MPAVDGPSNPELRDAYRLLQERNRRAKEKTRRLLQNRPQSWRHILGLLCGVHFAVLIGRLGADLGFKGMRFTQLNVLSAIAVVVAIATRVTWQVLFVNPYIFLNYRRPSASYRRAVYIVSVATTIPTLILHIAMIHVAAEDTGPLRVDFGQSIVQITLQLAAITLYVWMARRFLLQHNDEHYEPTLRLHPLEESVDRPDPSPASPSLSGHLSRAYARKRAQRGGETDDVTLNPEAPEPTVVVVDTSAPDRTNTSGSATTSVTLGQPPRSLRCQTRARFDYLPHSKLFDRLIPVALAVYATAITYLVFMLVQENSLSKFRSPTAKFGLYASLGVYLICAFASKRILRASDFAKFQTALPNPWIRTKSLIGKVMYRNSEDGSATAVDPRYRAFPFEQRDYLAKYNDTRSTCDQYWGHLGRDWITDFRIRPSFSRFTLLGAASYLFARGMIVIFNYPLHGEELTRPDLTPDDLERQMRIMSLKLKLMITTAPLAIVVLFYIMFSGIKLFNLWTEAVIKYAPAERSGLDRGIQL